MKEQNPILEDLSVLVRRGAASPSQQRRLDMLLRASHTERWLHELGQWYDQMVVEDHEDAELLGRIRERLLDRHSRSNPRGRRRLVVALVAAASLMTFGAAALTLPFFPQLSNTSQPTLCASCPSEGAEAPRAPAAAASPAEGVEGTEGTVEGTLAPERSVDAETPKPFSVRGAPPVPSSGELFSKANALRSSGKTEQATATYRRLQQTYPKSAEAELSYVLVGRMLLQQGAAAGARQQFAQYLRQSPGGSLAEEALHGQATALRKSGDRTGERRVLEQLLARFPKSIYAHAVQERLEELR